MSEHVKKVDRNRKNGQNGSSMVSELDYIIFQEKGEDGFVYFNRLYTEGPLSGSMIPTGKKVKSEKYLLDWEIPEALKNGEKR